MEKLTRITHYFAKKKKNARLESDEENLERRKKNRYVTLRRSDVNLSTKNPESSLLVFVIPSPFEFGKVTFGWRKPQVVSHSGGSGGGDGGESDGNNKLLAFCFYPKIIARQSADSARDR